MVRPGEKYKKNKQTKPDFLDMVPWYSGYISIIFYLFNFKYFFSSKRFYSGGGYVLQYISWSIQDCFWPHGISNCIPRSLWHAYIADFAGIGVYLAHII